MNAYTIWDMTHYHMASRTENLDAMLKIEAMRMYYRLRERSASQEFEREREVVRNEIRAQSSADGQVVQLVEASVYPKGHAYERMVGGNDEQIASASLQGRLRVHEEVLHARSRDADRRGQHQRRQDGRHDQEVVRQDPEARRRRRASR